jgi:serine/threonine protein phosphatase PrpC
MVEARENGSSSTDTPEQKIKVHVFGRTDVGMVREHNEDNFLIADLSRKNRSIQPEVQQHEIGELGTVFAVCDGMGGAAAGEVASKLGVDTIYDVLQGGRIPADEVELAFRLNEAICEAGKIIYAESKANSARRGMGTTATVAVLIKERLFFGQVGDSRAHIVRNGELVQTTKDQSLVQQLIDANQLTPEEARNFDRSNIILQALGTSEEVHVDITSTILKKGDILVICSDGLSGMVEPEDIRDVVLSIEDPIEACQKLTQMACDNGGDDNITVIVARFDGEALEAPTDADIVKYERFVLPGIDDDDSVTIPKGMPQVPGSAGRPTADSRIEARQMTGKLPFMVLLSILVLAGMIIGFTWKGKQSDNPASPVTPDKTDVASRKDDVGNGNSEDERQELANRANGDEAVAPAMDISDTNDTGSEGDSDSPAEDTSESETGENDSSFDTLQALNADNTDSETETERIEEKNQRPDETGTSQNSESKLARVNRTAGKWAHGKQARKRKSAQDTGESDSDDESAGDSTASAEPTVSRNGAPDGDTVESKEEVKPETEADKNTKPEQPVSSEKKGAPGTAVNTQPSESTVAPKPSDPDENPY